MDQVDNGWHPDAPVLLTADQAAEWCQVSREILDQWTYEPGFPVIRRPRFVRIHREELDRWLAERARAANPEPVHVAPVAPRRAKRGPR